MATDRISAILATSEHMLSVLVPTQGERLLDILNNSRSSFLSVCDAQIFRRKDDTCIATLPEAVLRKENIGLAIPAGAEHESPQKRRERYVHKKQYDALLVVLGYEVRGTVHLKGTNDLVTALCHEMGTFVPVPNAKVSFMGTRPDRQEMQVVIVNKTLISLFHLGEPKNAEPTLADLLREPDTATLGNVQ